MRLSLAFVVLLLSIVLSCSVSTVFSFRAWWEIDLHSVHSKTAFILKPRTFSPVGYRYRIICENHSVYSLLISAPETQSGLEELTTIIDSNNDYDCNHNSSVAVNPLIMNSATPQGSLLLPVARSMAPRKLFFGLSPGTALRLVWYYFLLYFFTIVYNVANKQVLEFLPLPATVAALQTLIGIPLFLPLWMMKRPKHMDSIDRRQCMKIAGCHGLGNLATIYALQSGTISFTHVVKSAEPLFTAVLSVLVLKSSLSFSVYMSLLPIVFGVALASAKELQFSWFAFTAAMMSNLFYQLRMVLSKQSFNGNVDENKENKLSAANLFRVITIFSFIQLLPIAWVLEGHLIPAAFHSMLAHPGGLYNTIFQLLLAGISFYLYNEIAFWILDIVHPVSHAVGNTVKRVVLVAASILIFRNPVSNLGLIGSTIAIFGSLSYALAATKKT
jgi:solute carrier family 35, member E1